MWLFRLPAGALLSPRIVRLTAVWGISLLLLAGCSDLPLGPDGSPEGGEPSSGTPAAGYTVSTGDPPGADPAPDPEAPAEPTSPSDPPPAPAAPATPSAFEAARLFVETNSNASRQAADWRQSRPADAALMERIAAQPQAIWFGDWNAEPYTWVRQVTTRIRSAGALPVYVLYNIPQRDCGLYSSGGASSPAQYQKWISEVARGIGTEPAVVILEPDAIAGMDCLNSADEAARVEMISQAVRTLKSAGRITVYIDAGNARWHSASTIARRLDRAGIGDADGFALNVSNFLTTEENVRYGDAVSPLVGGKRYVIDTSRNGLGPTADFEWCNPAGRALGPSPTVDTGYPLVDAFLWIKAPGESDGECNGGPRAGVWWPEYALGLAQRAG